MRFLSYLILSVKALHELGPRQLGLYAWYQLGLRTGYYRRRTNDERRTINIRPSSFVLRPLLDLPGQEDLVDILGDCAASLLAEADEILAGQVRSFGGPPVPLQLSVPGELEHWTAYEKGKGNRRSRTEASVGEQGEGAVDIKDIWEPGRFGWAYSLGRAYRVSGDERYAKAFWEYTWEFLEQNPAYLGPHWSSAQEVALRLVALVFAAQVFASSPSSTPERVGWLAESVALHAARIPPTLSYARAQFNNHLLTEALGLYTAGAALPEHPHAGSWRAAGWRWLHTGFQTQIDPDGAYVQHSANYHRLVLQVALWAAQVAKGQGQEFPQESRERLAAATRWLLALVDPGTGRVPNLGPNDGAYIQPLSSCPFQDYRPVLQAASLQFLGKRAFPEGRWDEMVGWMLGIGEKGKRGVGEIYQFDPLFPYSPSPLEITPHVLHNPHHQSWAYLRVARFRTRPGHADQLHLDLWWRGLNLAQDAGTYRYNAPPPWENALARTAVHNTITINGQDQMARAGRFLWLDWAQGEVLSGERGKDGSWERILAQHNGYRRFGLIQRREVAAHPDGRWSVIDQIMPVDHSRLKPVTIRLHWLLPDWSWEVENGDSRVEIRLSSPYGQVTLQAQIQPESRLSTLYSPQNVQVVRAGELLHGSGPVSPTWGWASPTYGQKVPALSFSVSMENKPPIILTSTWTFP